MMKNYLMNIKPYGNSVSHEVWKKGVVDGDNFFLKLDWNESTIGPSDYVKERILKLAQKASFYNLYPNTDNDNLISAIAKYVGCKENCVQTFASSDALHEYVVKMFLRERDKVVIVWPSYDNFRLTAEIAGADIHYYIMKNMIFNAKELSSTIKETEAKFVYFCNPNNPTGQKIDNCIVEELIREYAGTLFLIDEAYVEFSGESICNLIEKYDNLMISRTFSKAFALANFRIGYLVSSSNNINEISMIKNKKSISTFAQEAAIAALEDSSYMERYVEDVTKAREWLEVKLKELTYVTKVYPSTTNFVLFEICNELEKKKLVKFLNFHNVYVRELSQLPELNRCIRITIGLKKQMEYVYELMLDYEKNSTL
ncbi:pyridoxal phosphate-dependent aminotransferase [Butyrivibrio sp. NC3005]|uniref:pyridoxal phosphate-dependent aminotransferase n=1 Tax=Butyrivibrio sp. NC3005 TaxID=1280685 RepID=UPI00040B31BE|nr:histidinol-phosphate transaminase [Butyrivibrio sp. NC3005]